MNTISAVITDFHFRTCLLHYMSHSPNSFKGGYIEGYIGDYYSGY